MDANLARFHHRFYDDCSPSHRGIIIHDNDGYERNRPHNHNTESKNLLNVSEDLPPAHFELDPNDPVQLTTNAATLEVSSNTIISDNNRLNRYRESADKSGHQKELTRRKRSSINDPVDGQMEYHFNPLFIIGDQNTGDSNRSLQQNHGAPPILDRQAHNPHHVHHHHYHHQLFSPPPSDRYGLIYLALVLAGLGFLLPYNSFMIAVDYFQQRFPDTTIIFDMSTTYILFAFITVIVQNLFVESIPIFWRLNLGYLLSFIFMIFVVVYEIWAGLGSYVDNLIVISIISIGCTIQQSTFYGYTSMLPKRYVQAVMTGESAAGIFVSINRIVTKILYPNDPEFNTVLFFSMSIMVILFCAIVHIVLLPRSDFIRYHIYCCNQKASNMDGARIMHQINENVGLVNMYHDKETRDQNHQNNLSGDGRSRSSHHYYADGQSRPSIFSTESNAAGDYLDNNIDDRPQNNVQNLLRTDSTDFVLPFGIDDEEIFMEISQQQQQQQQQTSNTATNIGIAMQDDLLDLNNNNNMTDSDYSVSFKTSNRRQLLLQWFYSLDFWNTFCNHSRRLLRRIRTSDAQSFNGLMMALHRKYYIRKNIVSLIWPYILSIMLVYFVTLTIFPGIESEIYSCRFGDWFPIILMATFNLMDLIGKLMSTLFYRIHRYQLLYVSLLRFALIPLFALSIAPGHEPFFANPFWPILFSIILGLTNGIFGSLPMILAPFKVNEQMREITGNLMTFSYIIGLTSGSFASYILNDWINNSNADVSIGNLTNLTNVIDDHHHPYKYCVYPPIQDNATTIEDKTMVTSSSIAINTITTLASLTSTLATNLTTNAQ